MKEKIKYIKQNTNNDSILKGASMYYFYEAEPQWSEVHKEFKNQLFAYFFQIILFNQFPSQSSF